MGFGRSRRIELGGVVIAIAFGAPSASALEPTKQTTAAPVSAATPTDHQAKNREGQEVSHDEKSDMPEKAYWYLLEDKGYFLPPLADVNSPTNYMRFYLQSPVAYSTNPNAGLHKFWDVGFGEEFFAIGRQNRTTQLSADGKQWFYGRPDDSERWPTGWAFFIDGDMHMLLDFSGWSAPVIDSEFRIGGGFMGRGLPVFTNPRTTLSHFSWRVKFFHESTHIGDEYLDDIRRRQLSPLPGDPPTAGFVHANISYLALEGLLAYDTEFDLPTVPSCTPGRHRFYFRAYGGYRRLLDSPYNTGIPYEGLDPAGVITNPGNRNEGQLGAELRFRWTPFFQGGARLADYFVLASDMQLREQYDFMGTLASPRWISVNTVAGLEWGDWADDQMTFRLLVSYYDGLNPHGQFRTELLRYLGFTIQIDF
jgi:hypothetical protein